MPYLVMKLFDPKVSLPIAEFPTKEEAERYADERMKEGGHYLVIPLSAYKTKFGRWSVN